MSSSKDVVEHLLEQLAPLDVRARSMFGEYGFYCDDKFVGVICDDRCYLKPTAAVEASGAKLEAGPPYPGAKDYWILDDRLLRDRALLRELVQATADLLPVPKPKSKKKAGQSKRKTKGPAKKK